MVNKPSVRLPLWFILTIPFTVILLVSAGLTGYLAIQNGSGVASDLAGNLLAESAARVEQNLDSYLALPQLLNEQNLAAVRLQQLDLADSTALQRQFLAQMQSFTAVKAIVFGSERGQLFGTFRTIAGSDYVFAENWTGTTLRAYDANVQGNAGKQVHIVENHDPRTKTWYQTAVKTGQATWTPIYVYSGEIDVAVDVAAPVYGESGELVGVLDVSLDLSGISDYLRTATEMNSVFIVDEGGFLVASSTSTAPFTRIDGRIVRYETLQFPEPLIQAAAQSVVVQFGGWSMVEAKRLFNFELGGQKYLAHLTPYRQSGLHWWIVDLIPESVYQAPIQAHISHTVQLISLSLIVSMCLLWLVSRWITRPLLRLNRASKALAAGNWTERLTVNRRDEIGELAASFNQMADQLQRFTASLQASETRLRAIFENSADAIVVSDRDARITGNPAALTMFGYITPEGWSGKSVSNLIAIDERARIGDYIRRRSQGEPAPLVYETRGCRRDGSEFDIEVRVSTYWLEDERYTLAILRDITERKGVERTLRDSEARYRQLVENMPAGLIVFAPDTRILLANRRAGDLLHLSPEQMQSDTLYTRNSTYTRGDGSPLPLSEHPVIQVLASKTMIEDFELGITRPDLSDPLWLLLNVFPEFNEQQEVQSVVGTFVDITQRKTAELRLQEAERFARSTVDALSAHIAILDEHGIILSVNDAWSRFAAQNPQRMNSVGPGTNYRHILEAVEPGSDDHVTAKAVLNGIDRARAGETAPISIEYPCHKADEKCWFVILITRFASDGPTRIVVALENITERMRAAELLAVEHHHLGERLKELNCLYSQAKLLEQPGLSPEVLFQGTVDQIPAAWQYPEITCARLTIEGRTFTTTNFQLTTWHQSSPITLVHEQIGVLEVGYLEERPPEFEGPFLNEERLLIDELARRLGSKLETLQAEADVRRAHEELEARVIQRTAQLQAAKERVEAILNSSVDGIVLAKHDFTIERTNAAFDRLFACEADTYLNQPLTDLLLTSADNLTINRLESGVTSEHTLYNEVRARRRDGRGFDAEISTGTIKDGGVVCVIRDITERRLAEAALIQSEERYRITTELISDFAFLFSCDPDGKLKLEWITEGPYFRLTGYTLHEMGAPFRIYHPEDELRARHDVERTLLGETTQGEYRIVTRHGDERWIFMRRYPVQNKPGQQVRHFYGVAQDITARKRIELEEHEQRTLAEALLDTAQALSNPVFLDELLPRILTNMMRVVLHDRSALILVDSDVAHIAHVAGDYSYEPEETAEQSDIMANPHLRQVYETREILVIADLQDDPDRLDMTPGRRVRSHVCIPIHESQNLAGFLTGDSADPGFFTPGKLKSMKAFADQISLAMTNARLYRQEKELAVLHTRQRLARDLHDAVTQTMFSASIIAETLIRIWDKTPSKIPEGLMQLQRLTRGAVAEMRTLLLELRPEALEDIAMERLFMQLAEAFEARCGVRPVVTLEGEAPLPVPVKIVLYRITQESLNNIYKHAHATSVNVNLSTRSDGVFLKIEDNGRGFETHQLKPGSFGLKIMHERVETVGATLEIVSQVHGGTMITVQWKGTQDD
jgi:PAS domain S-box-containing protein